MKLDKWYHSFINGAESQKDLVRRTLVLENPDPNHFSYRSCRMGSQPSKAWLGLLLYLPWPPDMQKSAGFLWHRYLLISAPEKRLGEG